MRRETLGSLVPLVCPVWTDGPVETEPLDFPDLKELLAHCKLKESVGFQVNLVCPVSQETEVRPGLQASDPRDLLERRASRECQAALELLVPPVTKVNPV